MSHMKIGFSWLALVIFALPMLINIVYVILPPVNAPEHQAETNKIIEGVEQVTRILYLFILCFLVSQKQLNFKSPWLYIGLIFLALYYIVWIRYFVGGRDIGLMSKAFLFIPMPLAVFPVLYFICAAIWMHNIPAVVIMAIFGVAHNIISYQSFS